MEYFYDPCSTVSVGNANLIGNTYMVQLIISISMFFRHQASY